MKKITLIQTKSIIGQTKKLKETVKALGLKKINHSVELPANPAVFGMLRKVNHLVIVCKK